MRRSGYGLLGVAALVLVGVLAWLGRSVGTTPDGGTSGGEPVASSGGTAPAPGGSTLYCEFTNFADRNPRVGFYFAIEEGRQPPVYAQIFQRERDGSQADFGQDGNAQPEWSFDGAANPAVLRAPDDSIAINLYDYDPRRQGTTWFEAGLRSIRYLNLGGKCRRSAA